MSTVDNGEMFLPLVDLVYMADDEDCTKVIATITKKFPTAVIHDASDEIHRHRFEVYGDLRLSDFWKFALEEGFVLNCLGFQIGLLEKDSLAKQIARDFLKENRT